MASARDDNELTITPDMMNSGNTPLRNDASAHRQGLRTPRFIFSSSQPSGPGSATPLTATPRFLLGNEKRRADGALHDDEIETTDGELPSTVDRSASARRPGGSRSHAGVPARDEIPDSEDDDVDVDVDVDVDAAGSPCGSWVNDADAMDIRDMEDEYDLLLPPSPTRPSAKRRRRQVSPPPPTPRHQDHLPPPSPPPQESSRQPLPTREPASEHADDDAIASPRRRRPPSGQLATLSSQANPPSSTRQPRFILNPSRSHHHPPSTSTQPDTATSTTPSAPPPSHTAGPTSTITSTTAAPPTTPRRKPHFILPLTPSRRDPNDPTAQPPPPPPPRADPLFSPSTTRTTGRPGRPSAHRGAGGQEYLPGGMAALVRTWIFELSANRQAMKQQEQEQEQEQRQGHAGPGPTPTPTQSAAWESNPPTQRENSKQHCYYHTTEVGQVATSLPALPQRRTGRSAGRGDDGTSVQPPTTRSGPGYAAPTTLITPSRHHHHPEQGPSAAAAAWDKVLLFGAPLSAPPPPPLGAFSAREGGGEDVVARLKAGDRIGVRRGVVWEMEIRTLRGADDTDQRGEGEGQLEKWLVGVDWDIVSRRPAG